MGDIYGDLITDWTERILNSKIHCINNYDRFEHVFFPYTALQTETIDTSVVFPPNIFTNCINFNITDNDVALEVPAVFVLELIQPETPQIQVQINSTMIVIVDDDGT